MSPRALTPDDAIMRMNREIIPKSLALAVQLTNLGFPVAQTGLAARPISAENLKEHASRELLPLFAALLKQSSDLSGFKLGQLGSRAPVDVPGLVTWMNRTVIPKLVLVERVVAAATA